MEGTSTSSQPALAVDNTTTYKLRVLGPASSNLMERCLTSLLSLPSDRFSLQQFIVSDLSDIGEEAIIMFEEEGGVGAEEVVGTEEFVTCFVDSSQVRKSGRKCLIAALNGVNIGQRI